MFLNFSDLTKTDGATVIIYCMTARVNRTNLLEI